MPENNLNFSENALTVLRKRYFKKGEDGQALLRRVAEAVGSAEMLFKDKAYTRKAVINKKLYTEEFYEMMKALDFLPNSPTLMNAGTPGGQLSACFVLPVEDSMESIFDAIKNTALIHKSGGGTGFNFSKLRPKNSQVKSTNGVASGPVSFMKVFDAATEAIKQGGKRRGANMGMLRVDHPDIEEFISCKEKDTDLNNFNISVGLTDEFMQAVKDKKAFVLKDPHTGAPHNQIMAEVLWKKICERAWKNGDPGILFFDNIQKHNPTPHLGEIDCVNPCFKGDMQLLTSEGYKPLWSLVGQEVQIINSAGQSVPSKVWSNGTKQVIRLRLSNGKVLDLTPDHKLMVAGNSQSAVKASNSKGLRLAVFRPRRTVWEPEFVKLGFIQGDGNTSRLNSSSHVGLEINIGKKDGDIRSLFGYTQDKFSKGNRTVYTDEFTERLKSLGFSRNTLPFRELPVDCGEWSLIRIASFLRGLFSANGSVIAKVRVAMKSTCRPMLAQTQTLLLKLGINSYITTNKSKNVTFANGTYTCRESYDLNICQYDSLVLFDATIGFVQEYKTNALSVVLDERAPLVTSIKTLGEHEVYDFSEPLTHWGVVEGFIAHNCGEQPLRAYESCNLGSINLANMVKVTVDKGRHGVERRIIDIDREKLKKTVYLAVRFLDNVIEVNNYPLPEIEKASKETRKIGLGVMGFADMLAQMGIPYDSKAAIELAGVVMYNINFDAQFASVELAKERGYYPAYAKGNKISTPTRNATRTTIAPTGTLSTIAGCWGGIEPYFSLVYEKHIMDGTVLKEVNPYLVEALKAEYPNEDFARGIIAFMQKGTPLSETNVCPRIKELFKTAGEIDPMQHLKIQAAFQEWTDNAVSKTINLPNSATVEDISKIYMAAYDLGLKGVTVYRDGCKSAQVYYAPKKAEELPAKEETLEPKKEKQKTPDMATGTRIRKKTGCGQLYVHINRNEEGTPIEIFADLGKAGGCPSAFTEGLGRLASLSLKHGATLEEVRDELVEIKCSRDCGLGPNYIGSCLDGVAKAIHDCLQLKRDTQMDGSPIRGSDGPHGEKGPDVQLQEYQITKTSSGDFNDVTWMNGKPGPAMQPQSGACPSCGGALDYVEGCRGGKCRNPACDYYTCG